MHRHTFALLTVFLAGGAVGAGAQTVRVPAIASFDDASEAMLWDPRDLTLGPGGRLYVANIGGNRIPVLDPDTLLLLTEFGGDALAAPHDVSFAADGRPYVADTANHRVAIYRIENGEGVLDGEIGAGVPAP